MSLERFNDMMDKLIIGGRSTEDNNPFENDFFYAGLDYIRENTLDISQKDYLLFHKLAGRQWNKEVSSFIVNHIIRYHGFIVILTFFEKVPEAFESYIPYLMDYYNKKKQMNSVYTE